MLRDFKITVHLRNKTSFHFLELCKNNRVEFHFPLFLRPQRDKLLNVNDFVLLQKNENFNFFFNHYRSHMINGVFIHFYT